MIFATQIFSQKTGLPEKYFYDNPSYDPTNVNEYHDLKTGNIHSSPPEEYRSHYDFSLDALKLFPNDVQKVVINSHNAIKFLDDYQKDYFIAAVFSYLIDQEYNMRDNKNNNYIPSMAAAVVNILRHEKLSNDLPKHFPQYFQKGNLLSEDYDVPKAQWTPQER